MYYISKQIRGVAQPGSASGLGPEGRRFKSCRPDHVDTMSKNKFRYFSYYYWLRKLSFSGLFQKIYFLSDTYKRKVVFKSIHSSNHWRDYNKPKVNESVSGTGSDLKNDSPLVNDIKNFLAEFEVKKILDLGCGDFNWMKFIVLNNNKITNYLGLDIVDEIINLNNINYKNNEVSFQSCDILLENLPESYDLVIIRDLFIHLKNDDILKIIDKINNTSIKFLAVTSYHTTEININTNRFGHHRYINMKLDPFYLDRPFKIFDDNENQHNPRKLYIYKINEKS